MSRSIRRERRLWVAATGLVLLIYSTLYFVRGPVEFLRERNLLRLSVAAVLLLTAVTVVFFLARKRPAFRTLGVLALFAVIYIVVLQRVERPEEKLHFAEYGLLAGLVYAALVERWGRVRAGGRRGVSLRPAPTAVVLTSSLGWLDEGIQAVLPNRVYDLRDVALNAVAALLAVGALACWRWAEQTTA